MDNFDTTLFKAATTCDGDFRYLERFSKIYSFTTENISDYMKYFDLDNKSLLTVGSSGDQVLNSFYLGARDITLFDINPYCKYYVYLKIAGILSLTYEQFQLFFFKYYNNPFGKNKLMFDKSIYDKKIKDTLKVLDYESFLFFDELFSMYSGNKIRNRLFDDDEDRKVVIKGFNNYLRDEDSYNKMKSIIKKIYFNYINGNIFEDDINGKFDNIFLSNLCTVVEIDKIRELLIKLDSNNLNSQGSILLGYLWDAYFENDSFKKEWKDIYKMPIVKEKLGDFITEHHNIRGGRDILWDDSSKNDLVLIYRKK